MYENLIVKMLADVLSLLSLTQTSHSAVKRLE